MKTINFLLLTGILFLLFVSYSCGGNHAQKETAYEEHVSYDRTLESEEAIEPAALMDKTKNDDDQGKKQDFNTEEYDKIKENPFVSPLNQPLSTFSVDVDRASYANIRRMLNNNQKPYEGSVRIEEMINYFNYQYPQPDGNQPFSVNLEMGNCPWNIEHKLLLIGLQGKNIDIEQTPASNLVFLLDVSGSMNEPNKLPLLKKSLEILLEQLRPKDRVAIVVYAGAAGVVLPSTSCDEKDKILQALGKLEAGGSTAGGEGIKLAYKIAKENFIEGGNNRVVLATDGDFNIGESSNAAMVRLIEEKRKDGVFLTVLGFGMGNYKDSKMEQLSNAGNGNYAYIDNILEAKKTLGKEFFGTIYTIAKDVKIQIEFNPAQVKGYRLIGYENRMMAAEDFNDDTKDAGEIGSGHTVTALYEIIPANSEEEVSGIDELEYQKKNIVKSDNLMTLKLRYKEPAGETSKLIKQKIVTNRIFKNNNSNNFNWASTVVEFGLLLRESQYKANANYNQVLERAKNAKGDDTEGYRAEFIRLVEIAKLM
jgi:Ca-activated chloride channel family protein